MTLQILRRFVVMITLVLLQALVLNHIHIYNCATPLLYVLVPLYFNSEQPRWSSLLWCFCTGLLVDIFSNTPGVAAGAMTFVGLMQPYILAMLKPKEDDEAYSPTIEDLGTMKYLTYAFLVIFIYCLIFFTLESFSLFNIILWAESIGGSTLLTLFIAFILEKSKG